MCSKKQKVEVRAFQKSWTEDYGFIQHKDRAVCTLCCESVVCRTSSVIRHFQSKHEATLHDPADRKETIRRAVSAHKKQTNIFHQIVGIKNQATESSFQMALCIAKKGKPFTDGEYLKEAFLKCSENLFSDLPNKNTILARIQDIPSSARTIERRVSDMAKDVRKKQDAALKEASVFSVALDESVDINDMARLAVVARYSDTERIYEELCCLKSMPGTTKGEDIAAVFIDFFNKEGIDLKKIFCVTTDGAPSMTGRQKGFIKLLEDHIGRSVMKFHCIIHQESLCAKISNESLNSVMNTVVNIVNFLVSRSSLTHRQFRTLLEDLESYVEDIPLHSNVRWLSRGKVLSTFVACLDEIQTFLHEKKQQYPQLSDNDWLCKLMFLTDITTHFNDMNLRLQGEGQTVLDLYECWKAFTCKLKLFSNDIQTETYRFFPHLKKMSDYSPVNMSEVKKYMEEYRQEFEVRFQDFEIHGPMFSFFIKPDLYDVTSDRLDLSMFQWLDVTNFDIQHIEFKASSLWTTKFSELRKTLEGQCPDRGSAILQCWTSLPEKFSCLKSVALALLSAFGSTYICEQIFSHMKGILNSYRSRLTSDHSENCVQLKVTKYIPDIEILTKEIQGQGSH